MLKQVIVGLALVASVAAAKPVKVNTEGLIARYAAQGEGLEGNLTPATGEKHQKEAEQLIAVAHNHGVKVFWGEDMDSLGLWGSYFERPHIILLNQTLEPDGVVAVLAHELGHVFTAPLQKGVEGDIIAQGVSYIVCTTVGVDTTQPTFGYYNDLAGRDGALRGLMRNAKLIDATAQLMLKEMSEVK
jgi:hypothetical protein